MSRRLVLLVFFASSWVLTTAGASVAGCDEPVVGLEEAVASSSVVFAGRVTAVESSSADATVAVTAVWKGPDLPQTVRVLGGFPGDASALAYTVGATYLFFPSSSREPFLADACTGTRRYAGPVSAIPPYLSDDAGTATGRQPIGDRVAAAPPSSAVPGSIAVIAGVVVGLSAIVALGLTALRRPIPVREEEVAARRPRLEADRRDGRAVKGPSRSTRHRVRRRSPR